MAYSTLHNASLFYLQSGYTEVDVPWTVWEAFSNLTKPTDRRNFPVGTSGRVLVASGEQSFLQMMVEQKLQPKHRYMATTPCFRDEIEDDQHRQYFMKTELFYFEHNDPANPDDQRRQLKAAVTHLAGYVCKEFFQQYLPVRVVRVDRETDNADHFFRFDIVTDIAGSSSIELGSYGIRRCGDLTWIYGTGCAEPRLSYAIKKYRKPGYHLTPIPKGRLGEVSKIVEEYEEFIDAIKQKNSVMSLVELSDLIGAISHYVSSGYNMSLDDLVKMNQATERAFLNGRRG